MRYGTGERLQADGVTGPAVHGASRSVLLRLAGMAALGSLPTVPARITIGLIDGVPDCDHPCLRGAHIALVKQDAVSPHGEAVAHATFLASMLVGSGTHVLGLCPECHLLAVGSLDAQMLDGSSSVAAIARRLGDSVIAACRGGAEVIMLPLDIAPHPSSAWRPLIQALAAAASAGVRTIIPIGNTAGFASPILAACGVIPVAAIGSAAQHRWGTAVSRSAIAAPGVSIQGATSGGGYAVRSGSSFAVAFVAAAFALLRSLRPRIPCELLWSALLDLASPDRLHGSIPTLDVERALMRLPGPAIRSAI